MDTKMHEHIFHDIGKTGKIQKCLYCMKIKFINLTKQDIITAMEKPKTKKGDN
jgi:hypothetical protein